MSQVATQAQAYPGFCSIKQLGVFLLLPGWDASPSWGYPPALISPVPICTPGWREALGGLSVLPNNTTQCPWPGLEPSPLDLESSALTMRPLHFHKELKLVKIADSNTLSERLTQSFGKLEVFLYM